MTKPRNWEFHLNGFLTLCKWTKGMLKKTNGIRIKAGTGFHLPTMIVSLLVQVSFNKTASLRPPSLHTINMLLTHISFVFSVLSLASLSSGLPEVSTGDTVRLHEDYLGVCKKIASSVSSASQVFYPTSPEYVADNEHSFISSSEASACSVEPGCAKDLSAILQILGQTRTPFAVKSAGHTSNLHFSSTPGVQISLSRFNEFKVNVPYSPPPLTSLKW
ncbi:hypothetical protein B0F90DRAFT_1743332 [Multifurca ochricompacta]|uniref:Uncharacterized protein n=1 Tax=Multifurca ochricompacta TaxID=376703 RepID=A0AAD4QKB4_9AGAM|nr:hypothetical protein B0F90DRAFT_1743332 [Multifurca ochricompacta]